MTDEEEMGVEGELDDEAEAVGDAEEEEEDTEGVEG